MLTMLSLALASPLAIPEEGAPQASPQLSVSKARALRQYRDEHLKLVHYRELSVNYNGAYMGYGYGYGYGSPWSFGMNTWIGPSISTIDGWTVMQGPEVLDVPTTLERLGDLAARDALQTKMRGQRTVGHVLYAIGGASLVGTFAGAVMYERAQTRSQARDASTVMTITSLTGVGALLGGSFPLGRARRLQVDHSASQDPADLRERLATYNERVANTLGLTPAEALAQEQK